MAARQYADLVKSLSMKPFGEKDLEVLQNIEAEIVEAYRRNPAITDFDVTAGLDAVCRRYTSEAAERKPAEVRLDPRAQAVHDGVTRTCEWRLGRLVVGEPIPLPDRSLGPTASRRCR